MKERIKESGTWSISGDQTPSASADKSVAEELACAGSPTFA